MVCQCLHSSVDCFQLHHIIAAALVWLYSRRDIHRATFPFVVTLIGLSSYKTLIIEYDVTPPKFGCSDSSFCCSSLQDSREGSRSGFVDAVVFKRSFYDKPRSSRAAALPRTGYRVQFSLLIVVVWSSSYVESVFEAKQVTDYTGT